jgi:hypothetical protein
MSCALNSRTTFQSSFPHAAHAGHARPSGGTEAGQPTAMKCWRGVLYGKQIVRFAEWVELLIRRHTADLAGH